VFTLTLILRIAGYSFANVLALNKQGVLIADTALINDVREQMGGGGEPFTDVRNTDVTTTAREFVSNLAENATEKVQDAVSNAREHMVKELSAVRGGLGVSADRGESEAED